MDLHQLRTFLAVLEHGSFSRAAEAVFLTQSTVSFHIKALEREAGTRLLDRRRGKVRPTPAGRVLRDYATRILTLKQEALTRLKSDEQDEVGTVAVSASTIPGEYLLPPVLASFNRLHPKVHIDLRISDTQQALQELLAEKCDFAYLGSRPPKGRVLSDACAEDAIILVGPVPNTFTPSLRVSPRDLVQIPLILRESGSGTQRATLEFFTRARLDPDRLPRTLRVGSTQAVKQCVMAGAGLAFLSRNAVGSELRAGSLSTVRCPGTPIRRRFYLARLKGITLPRPARALIEYIQSRIR